MQIEPLLPNSLVVKKLYLHKDVKDLSTSWFLMGKKYMMVWLKISTVSIRFLIVYIMIPTRRISSNGLRR